MSQKVKLKYNMIKTKVKHEMGPSCMLIQREGGTIIAWVPSHAKK
jgi:hypothetical protein